MLRLMDEAYADYLTGMAALRKRVVADLKRKLSDAKVLDSPNLERASVPARPASRARHPRPRGADLAADISHQPGTPLPM